MAKSSSIIIEYLFDNKGENKIKELDYICYL